MSDGLPWLSAILGVAVLVLSEMPAFAVVFAASIGRSFAAAVRVSGQRRWPVPWG